MTYSRRRFMQWAASMSALAVAAPAGTRLVPVAHAAGRAFQPNLLASQQAVWDQQLWMAKLGTEVHRQQGAHDVRRVPRHRIPESRLLRRARALHPAALGRQALGSRRRAGLGRAVQGGGHLVLSLLGPDPGGRRHRRTGLRRQQPDVHAQRPAGQGRARRLHHQHTPVGEAVPAVGRQPAGREISDAMRPARAAINDLTPFQKAGASPSSSAGPTSRTRTRRTSTRRSRARRRASPASTSAAARSTSSARWPAAARGRRSCSKPTPSPTRRPIR